MLILTFETFPLLETPRLLLRRFTLADAERLYRIRNHPKVLTYLDRAPDAGIEAIEALIHKGEQSMLSGTGINWAIQEKVSGDLIGSIAFWRIDNTHHRGEIGYMLLPEWQGKGIADEAMKIALAYGFRHMKLHSVEANVNPNNQASIKLLEKHGFQREAYFRENYYYDGKFLDSAIYSLLTDQ